MNIESRCVDLSATYRAELLERTFPFWLEHAIDWEHGGILICVTWPLIRLLNFAPVGPEAGKSYGRS